MSPENEQYLDDVVAAGRFESRQEALEHAVRLLWCELQENGRRPGDRLPAAEWCAQFQAWAAGHRMLPQEADDSRESIYAGPDE
jgi:hypothetical protein